MEKHVFMNTQSTLSANTLFHFTGSKENLISILKNEFHPKYSFDDTISHTHNKEHPPYAIPMVCFCDIQLSQIRNHTKIYGEYALGLSKDWGKRKKINPVLYSYPRSNLSGTLFKLIPNSKDFIKSSENPKHITPADFFIYLSLFVKHYEGKMFRNDSYEEEIIRFYDEREWRYIPRIEILKKYNLPIALSWEKSLQVDMAEGQNRLVQHCKLKFEPKDIRYIIVEKDDEILDLMNQVDAIKGEKYSYQDVRKLHSRIISIEQILEDF